MAEPINAAAVAALADDPLDWRFKGLPASWWGRTPAEICAAGRRFLRRGAVGPVCVLRADALAHNLDDDGAVVPGTRTWNWHRTARLTWLRSCWHVSSRRAQARSPSRPSARFASSARSVCADMRAGQRAGRRGRVALARGGARRRPRFRAGVLGGLASRHRGDGVDTRRNGGDAAGGCVRRSGHGRRPNGLPRARQRRRGGRAAAASPQAAAGRGGRLRGGARSRCRARHTGRRPGLSGGGSRGHGATGCHCSRPTAPSQPRAAARTSTSSPMCWPATGGRSCAAGATSPTTTGCIAGRHPCGIGCVRHSRCGRRCCRVRSPDLALLTMGRRDVSFDQDLPMPYGLSGQPRHKAQRSARLSECSAATDRVEVGDWMRVRNHRIRAPRSTSGR